MPDPQNNEEIPETGTYATPVPRNYKVPDISCDHCKTTIEKEVGALAGVSSVIVNVDKKLVTVAGAAADETIRSAIDAAGYEVTDSGPATDIGSSADAPAPG